jgi:hypothetical protein
MYENGVAAIMGGDIDLVNANIFAMLIDANIYTADLDNDLSEDDIPETAILTKAVMSGKTIDGTTFRATDTTFSSVTGDEASAVIVYLEMDTLAASTLIAYIDNAPQFPITPDGNDIQVIWDDGANGIFNFAKDV